MYSKQQRIVALTPVPSLLLKYNDKSIFTNSFQFSDHARISYHFEDAILIPPKLKIKFADSSATFNSNRYIVINNKQSRQTNKQAENIYQILHYVQFTGGTYEIQF